MKRSQCVRPGHARLLAGLALLLLCLFNDAAFAQLPVPGVLPKGLPSSGGSPEGTIPTPPELKAEPGRQDSPRPAAPRPPASAKAQGGGEVPPFGASLFTGNFLGAREDGLNPSYVIAPGDHVQVNAWRPAPLSGTFVVDGQGNIFIPDVGPIQLAGVPSSQLTDTVRKGLQRVYKANIEVYTNLLTAKPVAVFVTGGVPFPGRYAGIPSDSVLFFLDQAGGIHPTLGSYRDIAVMREGNVIAEVDLYDFMLEGKLPPVQFQESDTILVRKRGPAVELTGDVAEPAAIEFEKNQPITGADALAVITSLARANEVTVTGIRSANPVSHTLQAPDFAKFELHDGDHILMRADGQSGTILVNLEGAYRGPSMLAVRRGARLVDVLNYIPVDPSIADIKSIHLRRDSVAQAQKESIDESLFRLERSALLALSASDGESNIRTQEAALVEKFVQRARLIQPLGRVVTKRDDKQANLMLEEGDVIVVPKKTNVVRITGEVLMAQAVMYIPGAPASDYIELAGSYTERADEDRIVIHRASAEVVLADADTPVYPGDEILVPPEIDTKTIQNIGDITEVIYQIAVAAAVVVLVI